MDVGLITMHLEHLIVISRIFGTQLLIHVSSTFCRKCSLLCESILISWMLHIASGNRTFKST